MHLMDLDSTEVLYSIFNTLAWRVEWGIAQLLHPCLRWSLDIGSRNCISRWVLRGGHKFLEEGNAFLHEAVLRSLEEGESAFRDQADIFRIYLRLRETVHKYNKSLPSYLGFTLTLKDRRKNECILEKYGKFWKEYKRMVDIPTFSQWFGIFMITLLE